MLCLNRAHNLKSKITYSRRIMLKLLTLMQQINALSLQKTNYARKCIPIMEYQIIVADLDRPIPISLQKEWRLPKQQEGILQLLAQNLLSS